jgi:cytidylate kinase
MRLRLPVVTMDGPAGSGKTTVSRILAAKLGMVVVDTGLFYRAVAWVMAQQGLDAGDESLAAAAAQALRLEIRPDAEQENGQRVMVDGEEVNGNLYTPAVEKIVSDVARHPEVRRVLLPKQRETLQAGGVVVAGRDTGTVVWPQAELKVYLDASVEVRARRKHLEIQAGDGESDYDRVLSLMQNRDRIDTGRETAPLRVSDDALVIDTDSFTAEEVAEQILTVYRRLPAAEAT